MSRKFVNLRHLRNDEKCHTTVEFINAQQKNKRNKIKAKVKICTMKVKILASNAFHYKLSLATPTHFQSTNSFLEIKSQRESNNVKKNHNLYISNY